MERIHLEINKFEMEINKFEIIHLENNKFENVPANLLHYNEIIFSIWQNFKHSIFLAAWQDS